MLFWWLLTPSGILSHQPPYENVCFMTDYGVMLYWLILLMATRLTISGGIEREKCALPGEAQLAQAQLQALKMQLHLTFVQHAPFDFGAGSQKRGAADKMIIRLGDFLRLTLETPAPRKFRWKELEFLKCYLEIE
jgi:hypothetical protein